jgi:hypothetical protein
VKSSISPLSWSAADGARVGEVRSGQAAGRRRAIILGVGALYLAVFAVVVWRATVLGPYSDMLNWLERYFRLQADGDWAAYLLAPHNEHRLVWTFLVLAGDIRAFGGQGWLFVVVGLGALLLTAGLLAREAGRAAGPVLAPAVAVLAVMATLMSANALDVAVHLNTTYVHALVFAVAAILLAEAPAQGRRRRARLAAALLCGCASGIGSSAGLAVWPALAFGAARRRDWTGCVAVLVAGAAFTLALINLPPALQPVNPVAWDMRRALSAVLVFLNYLALPELKLLPSLGWLFGLVVLGLSVAGLVSIDGRARRSDRIAQQLILVTLTTALMAAIGRTGVAAPHETPIRYAVLLVPAHVGLLMLAAPRLAQLRPARPALVDGLLIAAAVALLAQEAVMGVFAARTSAITRDVVAEFRAGGWTPRLAAMVCPDRAYAQAILARAKAAGLYEADAPGLPPPGRAAP